MPIFDYKCRKCGREAERLVRSPDQIVFCDPCNEQELQSANGDFVPIEMERLPAPTKTTFKFADKSGIKRSRQ